MSTGKEPCASSLAKPPPLVVARPDTLGSGCGLEADVCTPCVPIAYVMLTVWNYGSLERKEGERQLCFE